MTAHRAERGLLFDMDGTLIDSTPLVHRIWTAFAERHRLDPATVIRYAHGRPTRATATHFLGAGPETEAEIASVAAAEAVETDGIQAIPGAGRLLKRAGAHAWAMVTSATRAIAALRMTAAGLQLPAVAITFEDVKEGKPSPEGYQAAAAACGWDPSECIVFEDAEPGILAARAAGAQVVVVGGCSGEAASGLVRIPDFRRFTDLEGLVSYVRRVQP